MLLQQSQADRNYSSKNSKQGIGNCCACCADEDIALERLECVGQDTIRSVGIVGSCTVLENNSEVYIGRVETSYSYCKNSEE